LEPPCVPRRGQKKFKPMIHSQQEVLNQIASLMEVGLSFDKNPEVKKTLDQLFTKHEINLNQIQESSAISLLFVSIYHASWDIFNYLIRNGADIYYKVNYKGHKQINSIEYVEILLENLKTTQLQSVSDDLKEVDRLNKVFESGHMANITMTEYYAFREQGDMLIQVLFFEAFLRKYK